MKHVVAFFQENQGPQSLDPSIKIHAWGQMLVWSFADGWRQVDFGLTLPSTVPFTNEILITARSKHHSQLELSHSSKIYVSANVVHLFFVCLTFQTPTGRNIQMHWNS